MKCPYNRIGSEQKYKLTKVYNDDTVEVEQFYNYKDSYILMDCLKEECGVYRSGRCCYNETYREEVAK